MLLQSTVIDTGLQQEESDLLFKVLAVQPIYQQHYTGECEQ